MHDNGIANNHIVPQKHSVKLRIDENQAVSGNIIGKIAYNRNEDEDAVNIAQNSSSTHRVSCHDGEAHKITEAQFGTTAVDICPDIQFRTNISRNSSALVTAIYGSSADSINSTLVATIAVRIDAVDGRVCTQSDRVTKTGDHADINKTKEAPKINALCSCAK